MKKESEPRTSRGKAEKRLSRRRIHEDVVVLEAIAEAAQHGADADADAVAIRDSQYEEHQDSKKAINKAKVANFDASLRGLESHGCGLPLATEREIWELWSSNHRKTKCSW